MNTTSCVVVDDEQLARALLTNYIDQKQDLKKIAEFKTASSLNNFLNSHSVDLIFLDIQMPEQTGIEFLQGNKINSKIILTTAYQQFAIEGYQLDVIDYLLKPFSYERFEKAVYKAQHQIALEQQYKNTQNKSPFILVKAEHKIIKIQHHEILYIEGMREYVCFVTEEKKIMSLMSLKSLEDILPKNQFIRIHKSIIVNKNKVVERGTNYVVVQNQKLKVGGIYKNAVKEQLFTS